MCKVFACWVIFRAYVCQLLTFFKINLLETNGLDLDSDCSDLGQNHLQRSSGDYSQPSL